MEAEPGRPAEGEEQQHVTAQSSAGLQPPAPRPVHRSVGRLPTRAPRSPGLLLRFQQQQALAWQPSDAAGPSGGSFLSPSSPSFLPSTSSGHRVSSQASQDTAERLSSPKRGEKKPQKPGKYVCSYCGRPCAKPSVLQKHIRSHTGERPYPCDPCGFSFKTKSNLYKHRKSHAHRIKAGLMSSREEHSLSVGGVGEEHEDPTEGESTESEDETGQHRKTKETSGQRKGVEESHRPEDSQAVKQRLALRLSERKRGPRASPDDPPSSSLSTSSSSLGPGSKGSTESGYFSGSGSTDLSQVSPPSASAKTYAEIILGKYGRLGQQRGGHQQQPHSSSSGAEEKSISFTVPKTQVIEHITKLITINEAVVDTSEIDSVKPRRSSLSRKSSMESPKFSSPKDPYAFDPKAESPGASGIRQVQSPESISPEALSSVPLLRSHSLPTSTSQEEASSSSIMSPGGFRLCQSFDEQQAVEAEMRVSHVQRMLRRQPAIEVPLGAEQMLEDASQSLVRGSDKRRQPKQQLHKSPCLFECEACGSLFQHSEGYEAHTSTCPGHHQKLEPEPGDSGKTSRDDHPQFMMHYKFPALAVTVRKRRKEESLEEDPPSPGPLPSSLSSIITVPTAEGHSHAHSGVSPHSEPKQQQQDRKGVSVIQHTSSFEKQESVSMESQESEETHSKPEPKPSPSTSRLIRQPNIQVPEILVTLEPDSDMPSVTTPVTASLPKEPEKVEEFQWPQRSQTLAQLPAEKLPPKKKRLRLAEAAQSSGESSFESTSLPRSPSHDSSHTSSMSMSFEEPVRSEAVWTSSSQSSQMLMVPPASHQSHQSHKEMRRSASEQAPVSHQQIEPPENRSKSFDYGSLSSEQPMSSWRERRKCLLVKHATLGEPEPEEEARADSPRPGPSRLSHLPVYSTAERFLHEQSGETLSQDVLFLESRDQPSTSRSLSHLLPVTTREILSQQIIHRAFLDSNAARLGTPLHHLLPLQFSSSHRPALYFPFSPRLSPYAPLIPAAINRSAMSPSQSLVTLSYHDTQPIIATCLTQLTPAVSLVVPVRLQTHIPTYASAMYTTLSQILASTRPHEPVSCTTMVIMSQLDQNKLQRSYLKVPSPEIKCPLPISLSTSLVSQEEEAYGPLGVGGSKRMLSPAASLELSTEAQRHQKRVKEEGSTSEASSEEASESDGECKVTGSKLEEEKGKLTENIEVKTVKAERKQDEKQTQKKEEAEEVPQTIRPNTPSFPSLSTSTSVNWCYLNYVKPNPSVQQDPQQSVYSTWSVSAHNPNLPGFSTKMVLSLLCSKQRHSAETYTMATAPHPATVPHPAKEKPAATTTQQEVEINPTPVSPPVSDQVKDQTKQEKHKPKPKRDEEEPSTSKSRESSRVRIFEGGYKSNEEYIYVRGRGRGKYICGECGIRCKKPSMLKKHIRTHTDLRPYVCKHCSFAFKTKGNLTKHMKSKAHGKKCLSVGVSESSLDEPESEETGGSEDVCGPEEEHQFSDVDESEDNDDDEDDESTTQDDLPSSCSSDTHPSTGGRSTGSKHSQQGTPDREVPGPSPSPSQEHSPRGVWSRSRRASSPCSRRALFSRRGIKPARAFSPSSESCSPSRSLSPRLELSSPIHSLSPKTELTSPSQHMSPSPERGPSPIRPLSPLRPLSPSCYRSPPAPAPPSPLWLHRRTPALLPWESPSTRGGHGKEDKRGTTWEGQSSAESTLFPASFRLSRDSDSYPSQQPADNIFSHLPLHSQQARLPYLMIPIGGIQMVQARPQSHPTTPSSPTSPPMEGSSRLSFDSFWGGTPRTQGLRTPPNQWFPSEQLRTVTSPPQPSSGSSELQTIEKHPKTSDTTDSKQYGRPHSSVQTHTRTVEPPVPDTAVGAVPVSECASGQPERDQPTSGATVEDSDRRT